MNPNYDPARIENTNIRLFVQAAEKLGIGWTMLDDDRYEILLEKGKKAHIVTNHGMKINPQASLEKTRNKYSLAKLLRQNQIPVLSQVVVASESEYQAKGSQIPFPQVIKPVAGEKGRKVFLNITNEKTAKDALHILFDRYSQALVEPYFPGNDLRVLVLGHRVIGLSLRKPPEVVGDGKSTIAQLIDQENARRVHLAEKQGIRLLNRIVDLPRIRWYLKNTGLSLGSVLPRGKVQQLHRIPNYSAGGTVVTLEKDQVHPSFLELSERLSRLVNLEVVGIDFMVKNLKKPATAKNCAVLELNSDPGIRLHDLPNKGRPQQVTEKILHYFFATHQNSSNKVKPGEKTQ